MVGRLERAVARFRGERHDAANAESTTERHVTAAAFRAAMQERMRGMEREVGELKGRVNGLIFLVGGTVITQVVLKVTQ
jgi:hypothetical protein